jgi:hypothetical protein
MAGYYNEITGEYIDLGGTDPTGLDTGSSAGYNQLDNTSGTNIDSMAGYTYKDGVWTSPQGLTYDTKTNTGSLADMFTKGGIGSMLGVAGAAGLAQQLLGGGGGGYAGYQGGIPKYTAQRSQYALPVVPLSPANQAKVTDEGIKSVFNQEGYTPDRAARAMYKYGISPERVAGIMNLKTADVQNAYHEALGPNQSLLGGMYGKYDQTTHAARGTNTGSSGMDYGYRRPGSGGITYFSPTHYTPVPPPVAPVVPADTTATTTTTNTDANVVKVAGGGMMYGSGGIASLGGYSDGGQLLRGPGDGVSDDIPATIGNKQPARLADGEFVVPARIVSELGNGSTEAGARKLYAMMDRIKKTRAKAKNIAANTKADKHLPA